MLTIIISIVFILGYFILSETITNFMINILPELFGLFITYRIIEYFISSKKEREIQPLYTQLINLIIQNLGLIKSNLEIIFLSLDMVEEQGYYGYIDSAVYNLEVNNGLLYDTFSNREEILGDKLVTELTEIYHSSKRMGATSKRLENDIGAGIIQVIQGAIPVIHERIVTLLISLPETKMLGEVTYNYLTRKMSLKLPRNGSIKST